ncbi:hypothetical protein [Sphingomonas sp. MMS24-J13]|uniref:hypothetical protein n=1 Tax=Sphingomonas sp. MMS24-J13 TaxID=3238686 RepID=UPI00384D58CD
MKRDFACICGFRAQPLVPAAEAPICAECSVPMPAYDPPAWIIESRRASTPETKGTARG